MTLSEGGPPCEKQESEWSSCAMQERKREIRRTSSSSSSDNLEQYESFDTALDSFDTTKRLGNPRIPKASYRHGMIYHDVEMLHQTKTESTTARTQSFTTHSSDVVVQQKVEEEVTVTDDIACSDVVQQDNVKEEEVYKKLSTLTIVPPVESVPEFVCTPDRSKKRSTPATSTSSSPSHGAETAPAVVDISPERRPNTDSEGPSLDDGDDDDSVLSDISGLTGVCTHRSTVNDQQQQQVSKVASTMVPSLPTERRFKAHPRVLGQALVQKKAAAAAAAAAAGAAPLRKRVSFSKVCIREYERILGDNPSCSCGPSLSIGWNFDEEEVLSVNEWEGWREFEREPDRLVLCREEREEILLDLGYGHKEIAQAVREIVKAKNKRRQTIHNLSVSGVEELVESAGKKVKSIRRVKGIFGRKQKQRKSTAWDDGEESVSA